jgi:CheY-like chemotaxis protein
VQVIIDWWAKGEINQLAKAMPIDLILLDLMLPGGRSGYDIFDEIRAHSQFDAVPIVAVSATDPTLAIPRAHQKGFAGFISKPVDDELFPQQLSDLIDGGQVWHAG